MLLWSVDANSNGPTRTLNRTNSRLLHICTYHIHRSPAFYRLRPSH